jgi:hypothetical protein
MNIIFNVRIKKIIRQPLADNHCGVRRPILVQSKIMIEADIFRNAKGLENSNCISTGLRADPTIRNVAIGSLGIVYLIVNPELVRHFTTLALHILEVGGK